MTNSCLDKALTDGVNCYKLTVNWRENRGDRVRPNSVRATDRQDLPSRVVTRSFQESKDGVATPFHARRCLCAKVRARASAARAVTGVRVAAFSPHQNM